jgi:hypothetical protein
VAEQTAVEETQIETPPVDMEILKEAKSQGWVEKDHYRGDPSDWVDAPQFVKRGREILPILRKNNENLQRDLQATKDQLKEFRAAAEEFKRFQADSYQRKVNELNTRLEELKTSRAQAISDGDGAKANALDDALDLTKDEIREAKQAAKVAATPAPAPPPQIEPDLQDWLNTNTWFGQDRRKTAIANGIGESLRLEFPTLKGKAFLEKLDEVLSEEMPERFGGAETTPKPKARGSAVESGSGRQPRGSSNAKSYDNLPADAKAACDRFVKQKLMTREQYVADFDWSN